MAEAARAGKLPRDEVEYLKRELDAMAEKRVLSVELMRARDDFAAALTAGAGTDAKGSPA
jgi:uncharacterized protein with von Willebrand factor type A (vWA) domain